MAFPDLSLLKQLRYKDTDVPKARFWDNFSGSALDADTWTEHIYNGSATFGMNDETDGGFRITTPGGGGAPGGGIYFNGIDMFDEDTIQMIAVMKLGLSLTQTDSMAAMLQGSGQSNGFRMGLKNTTGVDPTFELGTRTTFTQTSILADFNWHKHRLDAEANTAKYYIDNILAVTTSDNMPSVPLSPAFYCVQQQLIALELDIRYVEVYST